MVNYCKFPYPSMLPGLFNPFKQNNLASSEITKPLVQKIYKSFIVLYTAPLSVGRKISVDRYEGVVQNMNLWYVKLRSRSRHIYIPTSFIYDKIVEVDE